MQVQNNRPSAQEQATADDKKRQAQNQNKNNVSQAKIGQQAGRAYQSKEVRSSFDSVLDNLIQDNLQAKPEESSSAFESKFKEKVQEKEKPKEKHESKEDKDSDSKTHKSESASEESKNIKDLSSRQQVNAKHQSGEGGNGGNAGGQGGQQKGQGDSRQSSGGQSRFMAQQNEVLQVPVNMSATKVDSSSSLEKAQKSSQASQIPKQVLDQIIQVIRVGINKEDKKEIQMNLTDKIFRGLSLKITSQNGKVDISFITGDPHVRRLFDSEKQNIAEALQEKGVQLSQIQVKYTG